MGIWRHHRTIIGLENDVAQIKKLCADLALEHKKLDMEFTELYDKTSRLMKRMARRYAHDQKENGELVEVIEPDDGLDPISRSILQRRGTPRVKP